MKLLITENKRYQLAYKVLDKLLQGLTREDDDLNRGRRSVFSNHQVIFKNKDGKIVLKWLKNNDAIYVYKDMWSPLQVFSFSEEELERVIFWWFKDRVGIKPDKVYLLAMHDYN
jgi:hypothetical protein